MSYIGVDIDNTLIDYDMAFLAATKSLKISLPPSIQTKKQISEYVKQQPTGEKKWQKLQGIAYGKYLKDYAKLYPGVKRFFWRCTQHRHKVIAISHKTEYGHMDDKRFLLRDEARNFLERQNLIRKKNSPLYKVIFKNNQREKISCIFDHEFEWFIDDLPEIVEELNKLNKFKIIYFNPLNDNHYTETSNGITTLSDWQQIDSLINGEWTSSEINQLSKQIINKEAREIEKISTGGNSAIFKLTMDNEKVLKLKIYSIDANHDRLASEFYATKYLSEICNYVNTPINKDDGLAVGIFDWIEGNTINGINQNDINLCLKFLKELDDIKNEPQFTNLPLASGACLGGSDIECQINDRLKILLNSNNNSSDLNLFLKNKFIPHSREILNWSKQNWPSDIGFNKKIPRSQQILSPSDFGFHNAIRRSDGSLAFLDFEYFGWDDPVKLICDFILHPGMNLTDEQIRAWINNSLELYGKHLDQRLNICMPLYGLIWCLILLNEYNPQFWQRRLMANTQIESMQEEKLSHQLRKANSLLNKIVNNYNEPVGNTFY